MSEYAAIINAEVALLSTIPDIGRVHGYTRFAADMVTRNNLFVSRLRGKDLFRGWIVTLDDANPMQGTYGDFGGFSEIVRTYSTVIHGFSGLEDASNSEKTFLELALAVCDLLDDQHQIGNSVIDGLGPSTLRRYQIRQFGSILSHYGEISFPVKVIHTTK